MLVVEWKKKPKTKSGVEEYTRKKLKFKILDAIQFYTDK